MCAVADRRSEMLLVTATLKLIIPQSGNILSLLKYLIVSTIAALPLTAVSEFKLQSQGKPQA